MKKISFCFGILLALYASLSFAVTTPLILKGNETGDQWELQPSVSNVMLTGVAQVNNNLIAIGQKQGGTIYTPTYSPIFLKSEDKGNTWAIDPSTNTNLLYSITSGSTNWITAGTGPTILTKSIDDVTWLASTIPSDMPKNTKITVVGAHDNDVIAAGTYPHYSKQIGVLLISHDQGATWTSITANLPSSFSNLDTVFQSLIYDGTSWVLTGYFYGASYTKVGFILLSVDGYNWTQASIPSLNEVRSVGVNNSTLIAIITDWMGTGTITSTDRGKTWSGKSYILKDIVYSLNKISWNGKTWIAAGSAYDVDNDKTNKIPLIITSVDGITWVKQKLPASIMTHTGNNIPLQSVNDVIWNGSNWIAVGIYDKPNSGCQSFYGNWSGSLTGSGLTASVTKFSLVGIGSPDSNGNSNVSGGGINYWINSSEYGIGLGGSCTEKDGIATVDVNNGNMRVVAQKAYDSDEIVVTSSNLPSNSSNWGYINFTGKLTRGY